jgi:hypothetical protein
VNRRRKAHRANRMNVPDPLAEVAEVPIAKRAITNCAAMNEAYDYGSAFSRGTRIDLSGLTILLISGTTSIDARGRTVHTGERLPLYVHEEYDASFLEPRLFSFANGGRGLGQEAICRRVGYQPCQPWTCSYAYA